MQIERVVAHEKRIVEDFNLSSFARGEADSPELSVKLQDSDMVKIFPIFPTTQKIVYLEGHVKRPGGYEIKEGMRVLDIIPSVADLLPEPYLKYAHVIRLIPPDFRPYTIALNLEKLFLDKDQEQNILLMEHDRLIIFGAKEMREIPLVSVNGEVNKPGKYPLIENMRVKDLIYQAGNLKRSAYLPEAEITRLIKTRKRSHFQNFKHQPPGSPERESGSTTFFLKKMIISLSARSPNGMSIKQFLLPAKSSSPGPILFIKVSA